MSVPVIGITTRTYFIAQGSGEPRSEVNLAACTIIRAVERAGGLPLLLPLLGDADALGRVLDLVDGAILTGGSDIDPTLYGEEPHRMLRTIDVRNNETEHELAQRLLERRMPVLAIGPGSQMLNVAAGGTLYQDCSLAVEHPIQHEQCTVDAVATHTIRLDASSRLASILGTTELAVNSAHHQCINQLAPRFIPTAWAHDGLLEAFEDSAHPFLLGVQWQPDALAGEPPFHALFEALIAAATPPPA